MPSCPGSAGMMVPPIWAEGIRGTLLQAPPSRLCVANLCGFLWVWGLGLVRENQTAIVLGRKTLFIGYGHIECSPGSCGQLRPLLAARDEHVGLHCGLMGLDRWWALGRPYGKDTLIDFLPRDLAERMGCGMAGWGCGGQIIHY